MTFGEKLKKKRIECCLTQNDLANKIHVSPSTISLYESDEREPTLYTTLVAIANTLQVSPGLSARPFRVSSRERRKRGLFQDVN